jgi:hypothetical protein
MYFSETKPNRYATSSFQRLCRKFFENLEAPGHTIRCFTVKKPPPTLYLGKYILDQKINIRSEKRVVQLFVCFGFVRLCHVFEEKLKLRFKIHFESREDVQLNTTSDVY